MAINSMDIIKELAIPVIVALITSSSVGGIITFYIKKNDKVSKLVKYTNRQAKGINVMIETMMLLIDCLHKKGVINGESVPIRQKLTDYLLDNTEQGLFMEDKE